MLLTQQSSTDLILATDMLDLATFLALIRKRYPKIPALLYFHENQITYPWSPKDPDPKLQRNNQYGFLNFTSALAADAIAFNSSYHQQSFLEALPGFLGQFPDYHMLELIEKIRAKSNVLPLGLDLQALNHSPTPSIHEPCAILWNHRWEYDKNPEAFFQALFQLKEEDIPFQLIVLGEGFKQSPPIFAEAKEKLSEQILHFGYVEDPSKYRELLWRADILPVTSNQDFFGGSVVEAMYCQTCPLLPNRLAYPEHIPEPDRGHYFYTEGNLYPRLRRAVLEINETRAFAKKAATFVQHYDWQQCIAEYDTFLDLLLSKAI
jgi:glycosyltransferase involved in cell wall biosynthesis